MVRPQPPGSVSSNSDGWDVALGDALAAWGPAPMRQTHSDYDEAAEGGLMRRRAGSAGALQRTAASVQLLRCGGHRDRSAVHRADHGDHNARRGVSTQRGDDRAPGADDVGAVEDHGVDGELRWAIAERLVTVR